MGGGPPGFVAGVRLLADFGWSFDVCTKGDAQLPSVTALVRACPRVAFMVDHCAKPDIKGADAGQPGWRAGIEALAALPNCHCKLSGVTTEADCGAWTEEQVRAAVHILTTIPRSIGRR